MCGSINGIFRMQTMRMTYLLCAVAVVAVNVPFGFWRAGVRKLSGPWFVAVHVPVLLVVGIRLLSGLGWHLATFPVFLGSYFVGQYVGGVLRRRTARNGTGIPASFPAALPKTEGKS